LLLGCIAFLLASIRQGREVPGFLGGLLLGLSIGVRETGVLIAPTLGLLFIRMVWTKAIGATTLMAWI